METVTISISRASVLADMRVTSHAEVAGIGDDKARYLSELGTEKLQEANQCITDAATEVTGILRPHLAGTTATTASDPYDTTATIVYALQVPPRKVPGLADAMAKAIHAYIVDSALGRYYVSVSRPDLAEPHRARLSGEMATMDNILYRRAAPAYVRPVPPTPTPDDEDADDNDTQG